MNRFMICGIAAASVSAAFAATIEKMVVRQETPWSNRVRIEYVIAGDADECATVDCAVRRPDGRLVCDTVTTLSEGWSGVRTDLKPGYHVLWWNPAVTGTPADVKNLAFELRLTDSAVKYMVVDISDPSQYAISYTNDIPAEALTEDKTDGFDYNVYRKTKIVLRRIHPGTFMMGSPETETGHPTQTAPGFFRETLHQVTLTNEYWIGVFPMSYRQFKAVCPNNEHVYWGTDDGYASSINRADLLGAGSVKKWPQSTDVDEAEDVAFIPRLRNRTKNLLPKGFVFSLPSEAQWEYACRAGTTTAFNDGSDCVLEGDGKTCLALDALGHYKETVRNFRIGTKKPNAWGLYDCHGGVFEMVNDRTNSDLDDLGTAPVVEPKGIDFAEHAWSGEQIVRGGSGWIFDEYIPGTGSAIPCRSAARTAFYSLEWYAGGYVYAESTAGWTSVGFRLAVIREVQNGVDR